jgi:O-antigen/teichoic acid export membrane protein
VVRLRDRIVGAVFVLVVVTAQVCWMGRASILLSAGLLIAFLLWIAARWKNDPAAVLPMCLLAIAVQCVPRSGHGAVLPTGGRRVARQTVPAKHEHG